MPIPARRSDLKLSGCLARASLQGHFRRHRTPYHRPYPWLPCPLRGFAFSMVLFDVWLGLLSLVGFSLSSAPTPAYSSLLQSPPAPTGCSCPPDKSCWENSRRLRCLPVANESLPLSGSGGIPDAGSHDSPLLPKGSLVVVSHT